MSFRQSRKNLDHLWGGGGFLEKIKIVEEKKFRHSIEWDINELVFQNPIERVIL